MLTPKVRFDINPEIDTRMIWEFLKDGQKGGFDFAAEVIKNHPKLKRNQSKTEVQKYVKEYYNEHLRELEKFKSDVVRRWQRIEPDFYKAVAKYFEGLSWPDGKYVGYISINPCGPRFLSNKTWQTPYFWSSSSVGQIIHEMLHFIFFEQAKKIKNTHFEKDQLWHLSEIFNDIIQKEPEFVKIQGYVPEISYPDHQKIHNKYLKIWEQGKTAKSFITNSVTAIKKDF